MTNKAMYFTVNLIAVVSLVFVTAFQTPQPPIAPLSDSCGLGAIVVTVLTKEQPCGVDKQKIANLTTQYFSDVVKEIEDDFSSTGNSSVQPTVTPTPTSTP